jgi:4Fe-4S ferredoxin
MAVSERTYQVEVIASKCENKQECVRVCPTNVFDLVRPEGIRNMWLRFKLAPFGGQVASAARESSCIGCMLCVDACPEEAIKIQPKACPGNGHSS